MALSAPNPLDRLVTLPDYVPKLTLGWEAVRWVSKYLRQPNGPRAGQRFELVESQLRFLLLWYEVDEAGAWVYRRAVRRLSKGSGKALALDTPLPTPTGWTTMGAVEVGDELLDEHGQPCRVLATTDVMHDRDCYRLTFRDGTSVVADADHLWPVYEFVGASKRVARTVSTREMATTGVRFGRTLTSGRTKCRSAGVARWRTLATPALDLPEIDTPLPPYLLGYWLGDGDSDVPRVTVHRDDLLAFIAKCENLGVECGKPGVTRGETFRVRFGGATGRGGLVGRGGRGWAHGILRDAGLLGNKHIPAAMFRASYKQRLELLRGLMDSDGFVDKQGRVELCQTSPRLAADAVQLMRSLGLSPRMTESDAVLNGRVVGRRFRINVTAYAGEPIFSLPRKTARLVAQGNAVPYSQVRTVTSIEPVQSVPVRCVSVSSTSSLYLAGEGMVPTHNSPYAAVLALVELCAPVRLKGFDPKAPGGCVGKPVSMPLVQVAAAAESQCENTMRMIRAFAPKGSRVVTDHGLDPGLTMYYKADGGKLHVLTSSTRAAEGAESTLTVADETEHWVPGNGGPAFAATLADNLAKSGSRLVETCNSWQPGAGSVAESSWDAWVAQEEGRTRGESRILYDARVAPPDTDLADEKSLLAGLEHAYGDCWWVDFQALKERVWDPQSSPADSRRKFLNQPTADDLAWTTPQQWSALADPAQIVVDGEDVALFFDGSKSRDATALIGCRISDGHVFTVDVWEPDPTHTTESVVPTAAVDAAVERAFDRWTVWGFFADVAEWDGFVKVTWPERYGEKLKVWAQKSGTDPQPIAWDMRSHVREFTLGAELAEAEINDKGFTHDGDSRTARHVINARRRPNRWGTSIGKETRDSPKKVDAAVCVIGARLVRRQVLASDAWAKRRRGRGKGRVIVLN